MKAVYKYIRNVTLHGVKWCIKVIVIIFNYHFDSLKCHQHDGIHFLACRNLKKNIWIAVCNLFCASSISENMLQIMCLQANPGWGQKEIRGSPSWAVIRDSKIKKRNVA